MLASAPGDVKDASDFLVCPCDDDQTKAEQIFCKRFWASFVLSGDGWDSTIRVISRSVVMLTMGATPGGESRWLRDPSLLLWLGGKSNVGHNRPRNIVSKKPKHLSW